MMIATLAWRGVDFWPVALAVLLLLTGAIVILYPPQVRTLPLPWRWLLPLLRTAGMLTLAVSLLRPVLIRTRTAEEQGAVAILLDHSLSMSVSDRTLPGGDAKEAIGQLVALAEGLGLMPGQLRSEALTKVSKDLAALEPLADDIARIGREVDFARLSGRDLHEVQGRLNKAREEFMVTARRAEQNGTAMGLRGMAVEDWRRRIYSSRPEDRRRLLDGIRNALAQAHKFQSTMDSELYRTNPQVRQVCDELSRKSRLELSWLALTGGDGGLLDRLEKMVPVHGFGIAQQAMPLTLRENGARVRGMPVMADGYGTDLAGGIASVLRQVGSRNVQAMVLFSDGRQIGGAGTIPTGLLAPNVPIFTIYTASGQVKDIAVDRIKVPQTVFVDEAMPASVTVRILGMNPNQVSGEASLSAEEAAPTGLPIRLRDPKAELQEMALRPIKLTQPGPQRIRVTLPVQDGEVSEANNRAERWVKVLSQKMKVLAIASAPSWDYRYLRNALARTSWVQLRDAVVVPGFTTLGMTPQEILEQDLLILSDVPREALTTRQWEAIGKLVKERGGSLIIVPGITPPSTMTKQYPLADLLPYSGGTKPFWQGWLGQNPYYHLTPAAGSEDLDALHLDERWDDLPPFYRYLAIPRLNANVQVRLVVRQTQAPVLTESRVGRGRVLFFGMNETWRWRNRVGEWNQDRFWQQLARYAMDEPYALVKGSLYFDADRLVEPGEAVHVRCRLILPPTQRALPRQLRLTVLQEGQVLREVEMEQPDEAAAGRYRTVLDDLPSGDYELKVSEPWTDEPPNELTLPLTIAASDSDEMANLSGDRRFLESLADATGGRCLNLEQIAALPQLLEAVRQQQPRSTEFHLWNSGYLFILVLSCLSAEWALRKRFGLA